MFLHLYHIISVKSYVNEIMDKLLITFYCLLGLWIQVKGKDNHCSYGQPLQGAYCGRGGHPCPYGYYCEISPVDAYADCCPDYCGNRNTPMLDAHNNPVSCNGGIVKCPADMKCTVAPNDAWAVCCPTI